MMAIIKTLVSDYCVNGFELRFVIYIPSHLWFRFHPKCKFHIQVEKARFSPWILIMCLQYVKVTLQSLLYIISIPQVGKMEKKNVKIYLPLWYTTALIAREMLHTMACLISYNGNSLAGFCTHFRFLKFMWCSPNLSIYG